jgi:hypothetical protein
VSCNSIFPLCDSQPLTHVITISPSRNVYTHASNSSLRSSQHHLSTFITSASFSISQISTPPLEVSHICDLPTLRCLLHITLMGQGLIILQAQFEKFVVAVATQIVTRISSSRSSVGVNEGEHMIFGQRPHVGPSMVDRENPSCMFQFLGLLMVSHDVLARVFRAESGFRLVYNYFNKLPAKG